MGTGKTSLELLRSKGSLRGLEAVSEVELLALVIGARHNRSSGSVAQELIERADQALLEAKRSGKDRLYLVGQGCEESNTTR